MAASLQAVSQQHYGPGQRSYLLAPGDTHRLYRSPSGPLPAIQVSCSEISLIPMPGGEQSGAPKDSEAAQRGQGVNEAHHPQQAHPPNQGESASKVEFTPHEADDRKNADENIQTNTDTNMSQGSQAQTTKIDNASRKRNSW